MTNTTIEFNREDQISIVNLTAAKMEMEIELLKACEYHDRAVVKMLEDNYGIFISVCRDANLMELDEHIKAITEKLNMDYREFSKSSGTKFNLEKEMFDADVDKLAKIFMELNEDKEDTKVTFGETVEIDLDDLEYIFQDLNEDKENTKATFGDLEFPEEVVEDNLGTDKITDTHMKEIEHILEEGLTKIFSAINKSVGITEMKDVDAEIHEVELAIMKKKKELEILIKEKELAVMKRELSMM